MAGERRTSKRANAGAPWPASLSGSVLPRGYVLGETIGVGKRTVVVRAARPELESPVCVKLLDPSRSRAESDASFLLRRAQSAAFLSSPAAPEIYDIGFLPDETPFVVMELIRGDSLRAYALGERLPALRAANIVLQILSALGEIHRRGLVHGRVDVDNVFVETRFLVDRVKMALISETWTLHEPSLARDQELRRRDIRGAFQILRQLVPGEVLLMEGTTADVPFPGAARSAAAFGEVVEMGLTTGFATAEAAAERLRACIRDNASGATESKRVRCRMCGAVGRGPFCAVCRAPLSTRALNETPTVPSLRTMTGRDAYLARLLSIREQAGCGMRVVEIRGEAGAGKTWLLQAVENEARAAGDVVVSSEADPYRARVPGFGAALALRTLWLAAGEDRAISGDRVEGKDLRAAVHAASESAKTGRVVLLLDDADEWDASSLLAVAALRNCGPANGGPMNLLVLLTARPGWAGLLRRTEVETLDLGKLPSGVLAPMLSRDSISLLERFESLTPMHAKQLEWFRSECGGCPPNTLPEIIEARVRLTDIATRRVLEAIASGGRRLTSKELALLVACADVEEAVMALQRRGLVSVREDGISCAHPLIRDVVMATTPLAVRRALGARSLAHLEHVPLEAQLIAARAAGRVPLVCTLAQTAARRASERGDLAASAAYLEVSLEAIREDAVFRRRLEYDAPRLSLSPPIRH